MCADRLQIIQSWQVDRYQRGNESTDIDNGRPMLRRKHPSERKSDHRDQLADGTQDMRTKQREADQFDDSNDDKRGVDPSRPSDALCAMT